MCQHCGAAELAEIKADGFADFFFDFVYLVELLVVFNNGEEPLSASQIQRSSYFLVGSGDGPERLVMLAVAAQEPQFYPSLGGVASQQLELA